MDAEEPLEKQLPASIEGPPASRDAGGLWFFIQNKAFASNADAGMY